MNFARLNSQKLWLCCGMNMVFISILACKNSWLGRKKNEIKADRNIQVTDDLSFESENAIESDQAGFE